jgi:hypothetical protein
MHAHERWNSGSGDIPAEKGSLHAIDQAAHVDEVDGDFTIRQGHVLGDQARAWSPPGCSAAVKVGMGPPDAAGRADAANFARRRRVRQAENIEEIVHGAVLRSGRVLPRAERFHQLTPRRLIEAIKVNRAVTLVAQKLDKSGTALFLGRLQLAVSHPDEVHLQRLHQKILGIPAIGARQRQIKTPFKGRLHAGRHECIA